MNKRIILSITLIAVLLAALIAAIEILNWERANAIWNALQKAPTDTSWVANVTRYLEQYKPYHNVVPDNTIAWTQVNFCENGTGQVVTWNEEGGITSFLTNLLAEADQQKNKTVTDQFLDGVLAVDESAWIGERFPIDIGSLKNVSQAYFVLQDYLVSLNGTIFVGQANRYGITWSIWAIALP